VLRDLLLDGDILMTQGAGSIGALSRQLSEEGLGHD